MNFIKLFELQQNLDIRILQEHNLHNEYLFSKKILALQVEISELANETRCFKFWSSKGPSSKETILEEYVDCLHFILSLGLEKNYSNINVELRHDESELTEKFINIYVDINDFIVCPSMDNYKTLFEDFLCLGVSLGFSLSEIENAYYAKNVVNHERQDSGY
jgi:dimeric dUTPase (all-alpha-NTP-PPase superfamily)